MKQRGTYALLGLFFVGLFGYWYLDRRITPVENLKRRAGSRVLAELLETRPDDLRRVVIRGPKDPTIVLERRGTIGWQMVEPLDVAANPGQVETLAFALKEMSRIPEAGMIEDPSKASEYGLAPPEKTLELWGEGRETPLAIVDLGKQSLNRRFVRVRGHDGIEVVDTRFLESVNLPAASWRERQLFRLSTFQVVGIRVEGEGRDLELKRVKDRWRITRPAPVVAEDVKVEAMLSELAAARVADEAGFVADNARDLAPFGLDKPRAVVTLTALQRGGSNRELSIEVGHSPPDRPGKVYVRRPDQDDIWLVDDKVIGNLGRDILPLRSQRLFDFDPAIVSGLEIQSGDQTLLFARENRSWSLLKPTRTKIDDKAMADFLKQLAGLQTSIFLTPTNTPDSGLDTSTTRIRAWVGSPADVATLKEPSGKPRGEVRLGRRDAGKRVVYAQLEGDPGTVLAIPDKFLEAVPRSPFSMRDRIVMRLDPSQLATIQVDRQGGSLSLRAPSQASDKNLWQITSPSPGATDPENLGRLFALLTGLPADGYVEDNAKDLAKFGLRSPSVRFSWTSHPPSASEEPAKRGIPTLPRGPETGTILLGSSVPGRDGSRFGMIEGKPTVFVLGAALVRIFESELRDRQVFSFKVEDVNRISLHWPKLTLTLVPPPADRPTDPWQFDGPLVVQPGFDPAWVGRLVEMISNLNVERFTQPPGPIPADTGLAAPRLRIDVAFRDNREPRVLRLGRSNGQGFVSSTSERGPNGPVFLLPEEVWDDWLKPAQLGEELPSDVFAK